MNWMIKQKLAEKKMLQRDLASQLNVTEGYVSQLVRGRIKDIEAPDFKKRVAEALGSTTDEMFT